MKSKKKLWLYFALAAMVVACTPKIAEVVVEAPKKPAPPPVVNENLSTCPKFSDSANSEEAETAHVLYRDLLKLKSYKEALPLWEKAMAMAPAADGLRDYHYMDGIKFYKWMYENETDEAKQKELVGKIMDMYDEAAKCYPNNASQYEGLKAFNLYFNYPDMATPQEIYDMFKAVADKEQDNMPYFIVNPFTGLMVDLALEGKIPQTDALKYQQLISKTINKATTECEGKECEPWKIIESYAPLRLEDLETIKGFYDCAYFKEKYFPEFEANPKDCDAITTAISRLKWGGCGEGDAQMATLMAAYQSNCVEVDIKPTSNIALGGQALRDGNYDESIRLYEQAISDTNDQEKKASFTLRIAKIYYVHKKQFSKAREYALKAAALKADWGEPYLLIGRLYASSGPLCGQGTGFDSQRVVWAAVDMWNKAKSVDPAAAGEARKFINQYTQYMPNKEDIFIRGLKVGDAYTIPCWIQTSTIIRAGDD